MPSSKEVTAYIAGAPEEQRGALKKLRRMIRKHLPRAHEEIGASGFAVYVVDGNWVAGFATRKKGPMLYLMITAVLDEYSDRLGLLRSGKSCVDWKDSNHLPLRELEKLANEMLGAAAQRS